MVTLTATKILHMNDVIKKCGCSCHDAASDEIHMVSCCEYTYQKEYRDNCAICGNTLTTDKNTFHYSTNHKPGDNLPKNSELWIGGPCLAVKFHIFMDEIFDEL